MWGRDSTAKVGDNGDRGIIQSWWPEAIRHGGGSGRGWPLLLYLSTHWGGVGKPTGVEPGGLTIGQSRGL